MAKKFFYACAGIFLLALGFHLGARNAGAYYDGSFFRVVEPGYVIAGGVVFTHTTSFPVALLPVAAGDLPPVSPSQIVWMSGTSPQARGSDRVITSDGRLWNRRDADGNPMSDWEYTLIPGGATPIQHESFGQLKVRYRGERTATPQGRVDPERLRR